MLLVSVCVERPAFRHSTDWRITTPPRFPLQFFWDNGTWDALPIVQNNVLLIAGENDVIVPVENAKAMAARLPLPWLSIFKEAGHGVMTQYRPDILDLVDVFLTWAARLAQTDSRWKVESSSP